MAVTMEQLQQELAALKAQVDGITAPPTDYYTSRWSGEEIDNGVARALPGGAIDEAVKGRIGRYYSLSKPVADLRIPGHYRYDTPPDTGGMQYGQCLVVNGSAGDTPAQLIFGFDGDPRIAYRCAKGGGGYTPLTFLATTSQLCNPNLLDNWYFVGGGGPGQFPVNQRGQTEYAENGYTIDRWHLSYGSMRIVPSGIVLERASNGGTFIYKIDSAQRLAGKTLTLSILGSRTGGSWYVAIEQNGQFQNSQNVELKNEVSCISITFNAIPDLTTMSIQFACWDATDVANISAVKMELGSNQTLAHQEGGKWVLNEIPNYAEQLARCQRYFRRFPARYMLGGFQSSTVAVFRYPCDPPMRTTPVITLQNASNLTNALDDGQTPVTPSGVVLNWTSKPESIGFYFPGASPNTCCVCDRYVDASADL